MVKNCTIWNKFCYKLLGNQSFSQEGLWFWEGTCHLWVRNNIRCSLEFLYRGNIELHECPVKFWNYSGFVWPFLYINWVFGHLMCIIQIWTASTCSGAPKLVEKTHVCPWLSFWVPWKKWEWNSNIWASWLGREHRETLFFNSCKSKTRLEIMKLGMVSCHGTNMLW